MGTTVVSRMASSLYEEASTNGLFVEQRMTSPELDTPLRTDGLFQSQDDQAHHTGTTPAHYTGTTEFTSRIFDKVNLFPLDYMHLV